MKTETKPRKALQIKIVKASSNFFWYNKHIGEVFSVVKIETDIPSIGNEFTTYWVREGGDFNCLNIVLEQDCEVV